MMVTVMVIMMVIMMVIIALNIGIRPQNILVKIGFQEDGSAIDPKASAGYRKDIPGCPKT